MDKSLRGLNRYATVRCCSDFSIFTRKDGAVEIRVNVESEKAILRVKDDGIGIPQALLSEIFIFYRQLYFQFY